MFDDIRGDIRLKTYVSYILAACMVIITTITIFIPELKALYGVGDGPAVNIFVRLTIPFQHGFDTVSSIIHLVFNLINLGVRNIFRKSDWFVSLSDSNLGFIFYVCFIS